MSQASGYPSSPRVRAYLKDSMSKKLKNFKDQIQRVDKELGPAITIAKRVKKHRNQATAAKNSA